MNPSIPRVIALPVLKEKDWRRKPDFGPWKKEVKLATYPDIKPTEWFTFVRQKSGKLKKRTLLQHAMKKGASFDK